MLLNIEDLLPLQFLDRAEGSFRSEDGVLKVLVSPRRPMGLECIFCDEKRIYVMNSGTALKSTAERFLSPLSRKNSEKFERAGLCVPC